ncbi:MAG TPA: reverse transcriptase family protein, partial [Burkholderiales bacterium]|nr:reverse transcriptase family protein [Burkholderiales bacterium]
MTPQRLVAHALADAFLAGPATVEGFTERAVLSLGRKSQWIPSLCRKVFVRFGSGLAHGQRTKLIQFIQADPDYCNAWAASRKPRIQHRFLDPPRMTPRPGALARCALPELQTPGDLATWLEIAPSQLDWYADPCGMIDTVDSPLCHYHYRWIQKRRGAFRLLEIPKPRLREIQRKILREILNPIPLHKAAHGFRRGRSCRSYVEPHIGKLVLLRMDLLNFFMSIPARRINALFKTLGYPEAVARLLTGLCTNRVPKSVMRQIPDADSSGRFSRLEQAQYRAPHLPQGAPTSPALANLCALHLDCRLSTLADSLGGAYTRYADDLAFSGDEEMRRRVERLSAQVGAIALEEGFEANYRKTRIMHCSDRQRLTGIVVNERMNISRREYDELKAILHNCARFGPESQNRMGRRDFRGYLEGRVGYV